MINANHQNHKKYIDCKAETALLQAEICFIPASFLSALQKNLKCFFGFLQRFDHGIDVFFGNMHFPIRLF